MAAVTAGFAGHVWSARNSEVAARPDSPKASAATLTRYLAARSDWAKRTPASIASSIRQYQALIADEPSYEPAFAGLADAYILDCEFASSDRARSFAAARKAADTALALAPNDPHANRISGFLSYWSDRDMALARPYFERALSRDDKDYLVHLWYGNALIDASELRAGVDHINQAAMLAPDVPTVITDRGIALWQAGQTAQAIAALTDAERRFPDLSTAPGYLALFALAQQNLPGYLEHSRRWAELVDDPAQRLRVEQEARAYAVGGAAALLKAIALHKVSPSPYWHGGDLPAAIGASLLGDRKQLLAILRRPAVVSAHWRDLRFPAEPFVKWRQDPVVARQLNSVFAVPSYADFPRM